MKKRKTIPLFLLIITIVGIQLGYSSHLTLDPPTKKTVTTTAPSITATGDLTYCPSTEQKIVDNVILTDPNNLITEISIQISTGYMINEDELFLKNSSLHPNIGISIFDTNTAKLTLYKIGSSTTLNDFKNAIKDINFKNSSTTASGKRSFSITIGQANYLPRNKHFYRYISSPGIKWTVAKVEAESPNNYYYGLKGYLATLTDEDEAQLAGKQADGTGWIGGTDQETEGIWKWATGPEAGSIMSYTNWNSGEPNNSNGIEHYAHITAPNTPNSKKGAWNDLKDGGDASGFYQSKGYIVEYGGVDPGDVDSIKISASTTLTIAKILTTTAASRCDAGSITLNATASIGSIYWYNDASGGTSIGSGNNFTTPILSSTINYYAEVSGCTSTRTVIAATINTTPTISTTKPIVPRCGTGTIILEATSSIGNINWFYEANGGTSISSGTTFTTPSLSTNTFFYAEANNNGCVSPNRIAISTIINPVPEVTDENLILCQNSNLTLDATINGMTYLWSTSETTKTINISSQGNYEVAITNSYSCTSTKKITIIEHEIPEIISVKVEETNVEIIPKNQQSYFEYSIDGINFQISPLFLNTPGGLQTASIREVNNCGIDTKEFVILLAPPFFTPNNDSYNDFWIVKGMSFYPNAELRIFDRYGKLLKELRPNSLGWDGTFNGQQLPASDYWYVFKSDSNSPEKRGHFTLKR